MICISPKNKVRIFLAKLVTNSYFEMFIFGIVIISSILMLFDNPLEDPNQFFFQVLYIINQVITGIFVLELMVKVIVYGLIANGESSYLRNGWNLLVFVIVI